MISLIQKKKKKEKEKEKEKMSVRRGRLQVSL